MASPLLDYKDWKHVSSDKDKTTLQHKKHGHLLTLAHNVLSKPHQAQLAALSKVSQENETSSQAQEAQDQKPRKMADGGVMPYDEVSNFAEGGPCLNPNCKSHGQPHPNCRCYGGMAEGGMAKSYCSSNKPHQKDCQYYAEGGGVSAQGQMVRHGSDMDKKHAKAEAKGRMEHERMTKPKIQGLAEGGQAQEQNETKVIPDKGFGKIIQIMAEGGEILHRGPMTPELHRAMGGTIPGDTRAMYAEGEDIADPNKVMTPMDQGDKKQSIPGVNININSGPQGQGTPQPPPQVPSPQQEPQSEMDKIRQGYKQAINQAPPTAQGNAAAGMAESQPQSPQPQQEQPQEPMPQAAAQPQAAPQEPMPAQPPRPQQAPDPFTQARQASIAAMTDDENAYGQDLKDGHITPKTYQSLFQDQGTIGKIGTIFGMLLSGAGAGLAHQSNAVFDMMNSQIKNDLQAQEKSKDNAQNFLRLAQQHELARSQSKQMDAETALKSKALANIYMNQSSLHKLITLANSYPVGTKKWQDAQQGLAMLSNEVTNENMNIKDRMGLGQAQFNAFAGPGQGGNSEEAFNQQQKQRLLMGPKGQAMAQFSAGKHLPGWQGEATRDIPEENRNRINAMGILDDKGKDVLGYVKAHTGTWNPQTRAVAQQKIEEMKNFYNDSIKGGALTQGRLGWYDEQFAKHPTDILAQLMGSTAKLNEMVNSNAHRRDLEVKNLGLDPKKREGASGSDDMVSVISKDGRVGKIPKANLQKALKFGYKQQ